MTAVGYATLPIIPSLKGLKAALTKELEQPLNDATSKARKTLEKGLGDAADAAAKKVEAARKREEFATKKVIDRENELEKARSKTEQATKKVEAATKNLALAQSKAYDKIAKAESDYQKIKNDITKTIEEQEAAERKLEQIRLQSGVDVAKKEAALEKARQDSKDAANDLEKAEDTLTWAKSKAKEATENLTAAEKQHEDQLKSSADSTSKFNKSLDGLKDKLSKTGNGLKNFGENYKVHATAALGGLTALSKGAIDYAAEAEQSYGAAESVFGEHAEKIIAASKNAAQQVGLSGREYRELSSSMGAMLKNMGIPLDEVADKSMYLTSIAADLAATYGGPTSDAVAAVSSLLRGETDPIERYGISIKQSDINARLAAEGLDKLEGAAGKQAHAQTILKMLTEQSGSALGQFAREADTAAGKQQRATASLNDMKEKIGTGLLPIYSMLMEKFQAFAEFAGEHPKLILGIGAAIAGLSGAVLVINGIATAITGVTAILTVVSAPILGIIGAVTAARCSSRTVFH